MTENTPLQDSNFSKTLDVNHFFSQSKRRYVDYYIALVAENDADLPFIALESDNISNAIEIAFDFRYQRAALVGVTSFYRYLDARGHLPQVVSMHVRAALVAREAKLNKELLFFLTNLGDIYTRLGDLQQAESCFNEALTLVDLKHPNENTVDLYFTVYGFWERRGQLQRGEPYLVEGVRLANQLGRKQLVAKGLEGLAQSATTRGEYEVAKSYLEQAIVIVEELELFDTVSHLHGNLGKILGELGHFEQADFHFSTGLSIAESRGNLENIANMHINLGASAAHRALLEKARTHYQVAREILQELQHTLQLSIVYLNLGDLEIASGQLDLASDYLDKGLALAKQVDLGALQPYFMINLGSIAVQQHDLITGEAYYQQALTSSQQIESVFLEAHSHLGLGEVYLLQDRLDLALQHYETAQQKSQANNINLGYALALYGLAQIIHKNSDRAAACSMATEGLAILEKMSHRSSQEVRDWITGHCEPTPN